MEHAWSALSHRLETAEATWKVNIETLVETGYIWFQVRKSFRKLKKLFIIIWNSWPKNANVASTRFIEKERKVESYIFMN